MKLQVKYMASNFASFLSFNYFSFFVSKYSQGEFPNNIFLSAYTDLLGTTHILDKPHRWIEKATIGNNFKRFTLSAFYDAALFTLNYQKRANTQYKYIIDKDNGLR